MFQLIWQDIVFESREQNLKEEVTGYAGLPGQFEDEEAMYEVNSYMYTQELRTDPYDSEESSDVFVDPAAKGNFIRWQGDFYQKYGECKEL